MFFSPFGVGIAAAILLPNLLFLIYPPQNMPEPLPDAGPWINISEQAGRLGTIAALAFLTPLEPLNPRISMLLFAIFFYALYGFLWLRYVRKDRVYHLLLKPWMRIPLPMAIFPLLALFFSVLWLGIYPALIPLGIFAVGHWINSRVVAKRLGISFP